MKDYEQEDSKKAINVKIDSSCDDPEDSRLENERAVKSVSQGFKPGVKESSEQREIRLQTRRERQQQRRQQETSEQRQCLEQETEVWLRTY